MQRRRTASSRRNIDTLRKKEEDAVNVPHDVGNPSKILPAVSSAMREN
jgi:hypothetical protein